MEVPRVLQRAWGEDALAAGEAGGWGAEEFWARAVSFGPPRRKVGEQLLGVCPNWWSAGPGKQGILPLGG